VGIGGSRGEESLMPGCVASGELCLASYVSWKDSGPHNLMCAFWGSGESLSLS
jgi:hypothetical protein